MTAQYGRTRRWLLLMAVLATAAACRDSVAPRTLKVPDPSAIIVDGAHNGGNDDVFFLPPLVGDPTGAPGFGDPEQLGLPVEIKVNCLSAASGSTCPNFDFPPSMVKSTSDAHYMVNFDTKAAGVDPGDTYRIEVHIGTKTIAWADVFLVPNGNPKNVATSSDIPLPDGRTLPIKVRIEKGWDCTNRTSKSQCVTQVVPNVAPDGSGSTIITFVGTDQEPAGGGRFYDGWIPYSDNCQPGSLTCVPTGTPVVVTIEDQTSLLNASGATCALKDPTTGLPVTTMLTQLGSGDAQHVGRCVKFTTNPRFTFAQRVDVAVCVESPTVTQQLLKYDVTEKPRFLQNVFFPITCEPSTIGSTMRTRSSNPIMNYALNAAARVGNAISSFFSPKSAYAVHLGMGGLDGSDDGGFSFVAPAEPYTESAVSGDGQTGAVNTAVAGPQSRITTVHPSLAPAVGQNVRCQITGGGGSLGSLGGPTQVVVQTQPVLNDAGAVVDAIATCPAWYLGPTAGANTLQMVALNIDDGIIAKEDNGEGGTITETLHGIVTFTATGIDVPSPIIGLKDLENRQTDAGSFVAFDITVTNRDAYSDALFAASPSLPPCGLNNSASRTWVNIFNVAGNAQLNSFCAFGHHADLDLPWFAVPTGSPHPAQVYLTLNDRLLNQTYTSNTLTLDPVLALKNIVPGDGSTTYNLTVTNRATYPDVLFAASPNLPACGENTSASRTWVDIYDGTGARIYGFCALGSGNDLDGIWFAIPSTQITPSQVYITLTDRLTGTVFTSNLITINGG